MLSKENFELLKQGFSLQLKFDSNETYFIDKESGIEGKCGIINNRFVVWFKQTDANFLDWFTNFFFFFKKMPYKRSKKSKVRIHSGYVNGYMRLREIIHTEYVKSRQTKIFVTGYSQGGGLAKICALDLQSNFNPNDIELLVGAPPKVFNEAGKISFEKRIPYASFIVYGSDPVSEVPFDILGFRKAGEEKHFGPERKGLNFKHHHPENLFLEVEKHLNDNK